MPYLPHILEVVVRSSSTWADVAQVFLFTLPNLFKVTIPMAVLWGLLLGLQPPRLRQRDYRHARLGPRHRLLRPRRLHRRCHRNPARVWATRFISLPRANQAMLQMQQSLETSQASYEIQPRVFYEDFRNFVLYVQDVRSGAGAANWRQVFMADVSDPANPIITTAASATVVNDNSQELIMRLRDGMRDETVADQPGQSNISTFTTTDMPLLLGQQGDIHLGRVDTALYAMPVSALAQAHPRPRRQAISHRTPQPFRFSRRMSGADACRCSARCGVAPRRQELGLRLHHPPGLRLLLPLIHRDRCSVSKAGFRLSSPCGRPICSSPPPASFCSGKWPREAASLPPSSAWISRLPKTQSSCQDQRLSHYRASRSIPAPYPAQAARHLSPHPR